MSVAFALLAIAATVLMGDAAARRIGVPAPLVLVVVGALGSYLPFVPELRLSPEVVLYGILPPLLYAAAVSTSLVDFRRLKVGILSLAVGCVLFTAAGVGLLLYLLLPIPYALGFAVGAIVAPPDAVAATAVGRAIGLPRRVVAMLEGESLLNDATALVAMRTALAAAGLSAAHEVTVAGVALDFVRASLGGVLIGLAVATVVTFVRRRLEHTLSDTILSFAVPFAAYVPAEQVHASGVIAVVVAGLVLGHRSPVIQSAQSRLSERINWASVQFLLENAVFLLIGLQVSSTLAALRTSQIPESRIALAALGTLAVVLVLRPVWVFGNRLLTLVARRGDSLQLDPAESAVTSWAGMRGVVTLAAALLLPDGSTGPATPYREVLVVVAVVVTIGTLLIQGLTLPALARRVGVRGPDPREDALQAASVMQLASRAGLERLGQIAAVDEQTRAQIGERAQQRVDAMWEELGRRGSGEDLTPSERYRKAQLKFIAAQRAELLRVRDAGEVDHEVLRAVLNSLDIEESMLVRIAQRSEAAEASAMLPTETPGGDCEHLAAEQQCAEPDSHEGCQDCRAEGATDWVHLRMCVTCGHVACCDSSPRKHATAHFQATGHPVMRSFEPGESWRWCFIDELTG